MRALILALFFPFALLATGILSAQERRVDQVVTVFREPRQTLPAVGLQLMRELADTVPVPDDDLDRRRLQSDLGGALIRLGELDASWRLSQRLASQPGELDGDIFLEFARSGHFAAFRRYWPISMVNAEKRCWILYMVVLGSSDPIEQGLVDDLRAGLDCDMPHRRDAAPSPVPHAEPAKHSRRSAIQQLRDHVDLKWCGGYQLSCHEHSPGLLINMVGPADGEGPPELVIDLIKRVSERRLRMELVGLIVQMAVKRHDVRAASVYVEQLIRDLESEVPAERDHTVDWSGAGACLWEKVWFEDGWGRTARASDCFGGAFGAALHLILGGEASLARKLIASLETHNHVVVPPDFGRGQETDSGRWAWIAILHLVAGNAKEAEAALERALTAMVAARDYPAGTFRWFMRYGRGDWVHRVLRHLSLLASGPDDLQRRWLAEDWAVGAIVTGRANELRAALALVQDGIGGQSIISDRFKVAMIMDAPYDPAIAQVVIDVFDRSGTEGLKKAQEIAVALRMYGARTEALAIVRSLLARQAATTEAWPGSDSQFRWAIELLWNADPQFRPLGLLSLAPTRERYAAHLMLLASISAFRRDFHELARIGPLIDSVRSDLDPEEFETQRAWRDIAYAYAAKGDLAVALDTKKTTNIRMLSDGLYTAFIEAWAKSVGLSLQ
ncbi:MAG: hypothetical protein KF889_28805 [Alphaproteobacteria bacterium]|nr:hypothetical protein [Alphaproteobacteria bacterium]MCW5742992.1 hypothetical protein [Alphaproteobacteria bacterium]